ncbi:MAG: hypothetical protein RR012_01295 [Oscillospiraceae bacterium]
MLREIDILILDVIGEHTSYGGYYGLSEDEFLECTDNLIGAGLIQDVTKEHVRALRNAGFEATKEFSIVKQGEEFLNELGREYLNKLKRTYKGI